MKVKLAFWYKGKKPGDVMDVSEEEAEVMKRDGRLAEVVDEKKEDVAEAKGVKAPENKKAEAVENKAPENK